VRPSLEDIYLELVATYEAGAPGFDTVAGRPTQPVSSENAERPTQPAPSEVAK